MPNYQIARLTASLTLLLATTIPCVAVGQGRQPIPDEATQKAAFDVIAEVYKADFDAAKTPMQKVELASKLLRDGIATSDDPSARYVMLRVARDIAVEEGNLVAALDAVESIVQGFEADKFELQLDAATAVAKVLRLPADHGSFASLLIPMMDAAIDADRYEHAQALRALALNSARRARDRDRIRELVAKTNEIDEIAAEAVKVKAALETLVESPTDPEANFTVGKFLCVVKGDWRRGVAMLALGSNEKYGTAARLELEGAPDALALGDAWWEIAESLQGPGKTRVQIHASGWYRKALPGLSGLTKARVERLLKQFATTDLVKVHPVTASGWPDEHHGDMAQGGGTPRAAIDGDIDTFTWTNNGQVLTGYLVLSFDSPWQVERIRLWKKSDSGNKNVPNAKNLLIQYTPDPVTVPVDKRRWATVKGLTNGYNGKELLKARKVNSDGSIEGDDHDSDGPRVPDEGWASLSFHSVDATAIRICFQVPGATEAVRNHYRIHEVEIYAAPPSE
jgi:hypothetical protein